MIDFALTMERYSVLREGPESDKVESFRGLAVCYAAKFQEYLLNENMGRFADYVSLQVTPVLS